LINLSKIQKLERITSSSSSIWQAALLMRVVKLKATFTFMTKYINIASWPYKLKAKRHSYFCRGKR